MNHRICLGKGFFSSLIKLSHRPISVNDTFGGITLDLGKVNPGCIVVLSDCLQAHPNMYETQRSTDCFSDIAPAKERLKELLSTTEPTKKETSSKLCPCVKLVKYFVHFMA
eukprot:419648-Amphidinium_carterae.1